VRTLERFWWLCGDGNRKIVGVELQKLSADEEQMKKAGYEFVFIQSVLAWHALKITITIVYQGGIHIAAGMLPITKIVAKWKGLG